MIEKTKKVYYCEHCKKKSFQKYTMENHEKHCTANPNRICGVCGMHGIPIIHIDIELKATLDSDIFDFGIINMDDTGRRVDGCFACALALYKKIVRENDKILINPDPFMWYEKMHSAWWTAANEDRQSCCAY